MPFETGSKCLTVSHGVLVAGWHEFRSDQTDLPGPFQERGDLSGNAACDCNRRSLFSMAHTIQSVTAHVSSRLPVGLARRVYHGNDAYQCQGVMTRSPAAK